MPEKVPAIEGSTVYGGLQFKFKSQFSFFDTSRSRIGESFDDHEIKMVYVCWREFEFYKDPVYQYAATQIIKNIRGKDVIWSGLRDENVPEFLECIKKTESV